MRQVFTILLTFCIPAIYSYSQEALDTLVPVRGFCIAAPRKAELDDFITFIKEELVPRKVNTLILRVDYNYEYKSHPELRDSIALSKRDVKKLVEVCRDNKITIIPQINLLGHQSWANRTGNLLRVYPQFDETPWVKMPEKYSWPNPDRLYCKSYCPLHPEVHKIVFELVDEICDVFEAGAFHAGMDEVFYIGEDQCPRCGGRDKAELFAGEVTLIRNHLAQKGRRLWIWGDRLIDGKTTGIGEWEASFNNTHRAIDMIPKDVVICDWHYESPLPTAVYFAMKGFDVVSCPWRKPEVGVAQINNIILFRNSSTPEMKEHFKGVVQTVWSGVKQFLDSYYGKSTEASENTAANCFRDMFNEMSRLLNK
ncbi:MAG TPA: family 20 glycosylhydrolase [Bacteroidales bacterium]|nr:family 20 glycosylhydrolase [Bacteroidales bacterium]HOK74066.1 family 20 glycosylhydrolase [Bacteroidales bacterium]HOM40300.1 family 20 glycosylhydrolase [Bacteroidales bacterium]HOU29663.1 family 20 glycosylhydrolase [Bacteroidales bacterium]HPP93536.1 family 20 glycosylhydrolase [Bacteroidales bacterium]